MSIFWDQLLQLIEEGRVVPVVGQDLLLCGLAGSEGLLYPLLAKRLVEYLAEAVPERKFETDNLPVGDELNEVACRFLASGGRIEEICSALKTVYKPDLLPIPQPLSQLAEIPPLQLFITTTFDSLMARALDQVRFGGKKETMVLAHAPEAPEDLSSPLKPSQGPIVYHLLGRISAMPDYAVTQEDVFEFFHSLQSDRPAFLFDELDRRSLLILGSRFGGWLTSFFIRMASRQRLSAGGKTNFVADPAVGDDRGEVLFLQRFSRGTRIYREGGGVQFVNELHRLWIERHPKPATPPVEATRPLVQRELRPVFLSFATEDRTAVETIRDALEGAGIGVFYDQDDLSPGVDWERTLMNSIRKCSLFLPILSRKTLTRERRVFRAEWNEAVAEARKASFYKDRVFILPVVIDDLKPEEADAPELFKKLQWLLLEGGRPTLDFVNRVRSLSSESS